MPDVLPVPFSTGAANAPVAAQATSAPPPAPVTSPVQVGELQDLMNPPVSPTPAPAGKLTPEQMQSVVGAPPPAGKLTPEQIQQLGPTPTGNALKDFSVDDLVKAATDDPSFDPVALYQQADPETKSDQAVWDKTKLAYNKLQQSKLFSGVTVGGIAKTLAETGLGAAEWGINTTKALADSPVAVKNLLHEDLTPEERARYIDRLREQTEGGAGTVTGLLGLGAMASKVGNKVLQWTGIKDSPADYTPEQMDKALVNEIATRNLLARSATGDIPGFRDRAAFLKAEGKPIRPEEVQKLGAASPFVWGGAGLAFGAAGAGVRALARTGEGAIIPATAGSAFDFGQAARVALGKSTVGLGTAIEKTGAGVEKIAEHPITKTVGPAVGALLGHEHGGVTGAIIGGTAEKVLEKVPRYAEKAGGKIVDLGQQVAGPSEEVTSRTAQAVRDIAEASPQAAAQLAGGAAFDVGLLAATTDTPQDRAGFTPFGTVFGGAGAAKELGSRVVSGQIIAPRAYGTDTFVPNTQNFPDLGALHNVAYNSAPRGVQTRINAIRSFTKGIGSPTEVFYAPRPTEGQPDPLPAILQKAGLSPEQAAIWADQSGVNTAALTDANGTRRPVVIFRDIDAAPHEATHAMDDVIGAKGVQALNDFAKKSYSPEDWNNFLTKYADRMGNPGEDPGSFVLTQTGEGDAVAKEKLIRGIQDRDAQVKAINDAQAAADAQGKPLWQTTLTPEETQQAVDNYVAGEIRAENGDAWIKAGQNPNTLGGKMWRTAANMISFFGGEPLSGRVSEFGQVPLNYRVIQAQARAAKGLRANLPEVAPREPGTPAPIVQPNKPLPPRSIPSTEEQRQVAAQEAQALASKATTPPVKDALTTSANAIANGQGVRIDTNSQTDKKFFPYRVVETKDGGHTILGWDPGIFEQNAHDFFRYVSDHPEIQSLVPFKTDKGLRSLTPPEWNRFNEAVKTFVSNQTAGFTGSGKELVVPQATQARGEIFPPEKTGAKPEQLDQNVADLINHLMSSKGQLSAIPRTDIVRGTKLPRNIQAREISEATEPGRVSETGRQFSGEQAIKTGVAGQPIVEVNPLRAAMKAASPGLPEPKNVLQQLNMANIKKITPAPELPNFRANVLTTTAGFQPKVPVEFEGKSGKKYKGTFDGYQDFSVLGKGIVPQFTAHEDMSGEGGPVAGSTTYGPTLTAKGFKVPEVPKTQFQPAQGAHNDDIRRIARDFSPDDYRGNAPVNEDRAKQIADLYASLPHAPDNPEVKKSYDAFKRDTVDQWDKLTENGYTMEPWRGEGQPYANSAEMAKDVRDNKHLWFFPTEAGYGEAGAPPAHPLLERSGISVNGQELPYNDVFRAVHDAFGHAKEGYEFGPRGELNAYLSHSQMYSPEARPAMAAETLGQNSWVNFGQHLRNPEGDIPKRGEPGFIPPAERPFAEQKANILPADATQMQAQPKTFIVRHGSTEMNNADPDKDLIRGHIDIPLDEKGRQEAEQTAKEIADQGGVDHIITSDLSRTKETADEIAKTTGATVETTPGLRPWKFGPTIEGKPTAQMLPRIRELTENPDERPPGGETFNEFKDRFLGAFHKAQDENPDQNTAIVTHYRGTKLLDAWRATGTDNDTIDKAVFENYDKDKKPGNVDVVDKTGAEFRPRKQQEEEKTPLIHYSNTEGLKTLEPEYHGTGAPGAEAARKRDYPELYVPRTYFGTKGYEKEPGLGDVRYRAEVRAGKLYDIEEDPRGLYPSSDELEKAGYAPMDQRAALSLYEKRIQDAGYEGYLSPSNNAVAKFTSTKVKPIPEGVQFRPSQPKAEDFKDEKTLRTALQSPHWAILTANQEARGDATSEVNQLANENLEKALIADGYNPTSVSGEYKGVDRGKSFLVPGMTPEEATKYGNQYGQESVLTPEGYRYGDSTVAPADHEKTIIGPAAKKEEGWSQVEGGPPFSMSIDFDNRRPAAQFRPPPPEKEPGLPGFEQFATKKVLPSAVIGKMTAKERADYFPEMVKPSKEGEAIPSEITKSPLYKQAGSEPAAVNAFADRITDFADKYKDSKEFQDGAKWYSNIVPKIRAAFPKTADLFAQLLAGTSPGTSPDQNFDMAVEAHDRYVAGAYDKQLKKFQQGLEMIEKDNWRSWYNRELNSGRIKNPPKEPSEATFLARWVDAHDLKPRKANGKLFGTESDSVLRILSGIWMEQNAGPKTRQFVQNLLGTDRGPTIDLWADRTMRWAGYEGFKDRWRIHPDNVKGVSDEDFAFAQKAFTEAAQRMHMSPDALQGALWFAEKQRWADNGWSRLDLGTYEKGFERIPSLRERLRIEEAAKPSQQQELLVAPRPT